MFAAGLFQLYGVVTCRSYEQDAGDDGPDTAVAVAGADLFFRKEDVVAEGRQLNLGPAVLPGFYGKPLRSVLLIVSIFVHIAYIIPSCATDGLRRYATHHSQPSVYMCLGSQG